MLLGLSACVLVIACSNLATILLSGAIERRRESAVRAAIGASCLQLARPLLLESMLLAAAGGSAGLLVATWASGWLRTSLADAIGFEFPTDWRVVAFAVAAAALTVVATSLAPSLFAMRTDANAVLKSGGWRGSAGAGQKRFHGVLVGLQFAVATVLVVAGRTSADELVDSIGSQVTLLRRLLAAFAALGAFLALVGIYGVMTRTVAQRTTEIGVRLAIGAQVHAVTRWLIWSSLRAAVIGIGAGVAGGVAAARGFGSVFPGMHVHAAAIVTSAVVLLAGVAIGVCLLSARRISAIDPIVALRAD